jgi:hypothetical protein
MDESSAYLEILQSSPASDHLENLALLEQSTHFSRRELTVMWRTFIKVFKNHLFLKLVVTASFSAGVSIQSHI